MRGLITKECLVICFLVAVTLQLQWVDGSSEARQTRAFAKRANETHDHDHDPIAEILAILDENNDTLIDPEEFHEWFELIFPVLLEHEEGGGHSGHAHRRRNDNEAISSKESQRSSQRWKRSSIVHTQIVGAMRDQHRFASHSRSTPQSFPEGTPMEGLRAKRDAHCPLDEDLFAEFDEDASGFLNETEIGEVALEMMVMLLEGCNEEPEEEDDHCGPGDDWEYWLAGLASVFLVCILSLVGVVLIPCMGEAHRGWQAYMMMTMVAFAAGALFGDAIFHILPSIFGAHSHDHGGGHEHGGEEEEEKNEKEYLGLAALCMIGVLLFFIIEKMILFFIGKGHSHSLADDSDEEGEDMEKKSEEKDDDESSKDDEESSTSHSSDSEVEQGGSRINLVERLQNSYAKTKELGSGSVIVGSTKALKQQSINSVRRLKFVKSYGWLNLTADAFHNFIDGIAIGASYSQSLSLGISTTLAVIFHEIPQELGDYAMIVKAGFGKVFALGFNLFSALLAILGCLIGLGVGEAASSGDDWILAFTAGGFLYISLANMVPELHTYTRKRHWTGLVYILLQLSGFILGAGLLLLLAAFEEDISIGC